MEGAGFCLTGQNSKVPLIDRGEQPQHWAHKGAVGPDPIAEREQQAHDRPRRGGHTAFEIKSWQESSRKTGSGHHDGTEGPATYVREAFIFLSNAFYMYSPSEFVRQYANRA
ncbi:hypothetical protein BGZ72_000819 [Mortierella alpina]|nr:hypothetical protein BGZ72_000819 [Mortierella alpina]